MKDCSVLEGVLHTALLCATGRTTNKLTYSSLHTVPYWSLFLTTKWRLHQYCTVPRLLYNTIINRKKWVWLDFFCRWKLISHKERARKIIWYGIYARLLTNTKTPRPVGKAGRARANYRCWNSPRMTRYGTLRAHEDLHTSVFVFKEPARTASRIASHSSNTDWTRLRLFVLTTVVE